jgi:acetyltransferase
LINSSFKGKIFAINPKRKNVLGYKCYPSVKDIPKKIDLAIIATPSITVPNIISESEISGVHGVIIVSAGFKEMGESGEKLEKQILANKKKLRIIGPNCLGIMNPYLDLNATFASDMVLKGNIAFISQSGALGTAVLDWSLKEKIGFSAFVSIGSMIDVNWGDLINYFGNDSNTKSILIYMENVSDPRAFLSAAKEVALTKPIILIKAGKTSESAKAAKSHTGALTGSDEVLNAALKRVGILRVDSIESLFGMAEFFAKQPLTKGPNLAIVTNAGGPAVIATDALIINKGSLAKLQSKTYEKLNEFLPKAWSHNNPIDILGDASPDLYYDTVKIVAEDPNVEGILVILTPQFMTDPTGVANKIKDFANIKKPIFAAWMGAKSIEEGSRILLESKVPVFEYPDLACEAFANMWSYKYNLASLYETDKIYGELETEKKIKQKHKTIVNILDKARKENRTILDEFESKLVLQTFDIPIVTTMVAKNEKEAIEFAEEIGFPVVLKLYSKTITHKTDVGGVILNLTNSNEVKLAFFKIRDSLKDLGKEKEFEGVTVQKMIKKEGYELILGCSKDEQFGPIILFGSGGELVEIYKDRALALPPLTINLAKRLIEKTKIYEALKGTRGRKAVNLDELEKILTYFSDLIARYPEIKECDINPLLVTTDQIIALDARIILYEKSEKFPKLAIRPYPSHYVFDLKLKDKTEVVIRPIRPEDESLVIQFYKEISEKSLKQRYLKVLHYNEIVAHEKLVRMCHIDYDREITLIVELFEKSSREILAIGRFTKLTGSNDATYAILVKDKWHRKGIGRQLLKHIIRIAKEEKIENLFSQMYEDNIPMRKLCESLGFTFEKLEKQNIVIAKLDLKL